MLSLRSPLATLTGTERLTFSLKSSKKMGGTLWKSILGLTNPKTENRRTESWRNSVISSNVFEVYLTCIVFIRTQYLIVSISVVLITLAMSCLCWEFNTGLRMYSAHLNRQLQKKIYIVSGLKYWLKTRCCSFFDILTAKKHRYSKRERRVFDVRWHLLLELLDHTPRRENKLGGTVSHRFAMWLHHTAHFSFWTWIR